MELQSQCCQQRKAYQESQSSGDNPETRIEIITVRGVEKGIRLDLIESFGGCVKAYAPYSAIEWGVRCRA